MVKLIKKPDKINIETINEVTDLSKKILKILYFFMIVGLIFVATLVIKEWKIFGFIKILFSICSPLFIGFIIAWLFNPVVTYLNKKGISRIFGTIIVFLVISCFLIIFFGSLIPAFLEQLNDFISLIPELLTQIKDTINNFFKNFNIIEGLDTNNLKLNSIKAIEEYANSISYSLPNNILSFISSLFSGTAVFVLSLIIGFYMLLNFNETSKHFVSLFPKKYYYELNVLIAEISSQLYKYVKGMLSVASVVFVCCTIGFSFIGLPSPLLFGFFCGITDLIPYVGPYIGGILAVIIAFSQNSLMGILAIIIIVVVQLLEGYVLQPVIMSKTMRIHPVTIMIGLVVFGYFFGIMGMVLATPIISLSKILLKYFANKYDWFQNYE